MRSGLNLSTWQKNFEATLEHAWIHSSINMAINPLTIKTMPELFQNIKKWKERKQGHLDYSFMTCVYPEHFNPEIFGPGVFKNDFDQVLAEMPDRTDQEKTYKEHMRGIQLQIENSKRNPQKIKALQIFLDELDRRRGTNWRKVFPWLESHFSTHPAVEGSHLSQT